MTEEISPQASSEAPPQDERTSFFWWELNPRQRFRREVKTTPLLAVGGWFLGRSAVDPWLLGAGLLVGAAATLGHSWYRWKQWERESRDRSHGSISAAATSVGVPAPA